jgi:rhamnogalacturonyl hydrolase YesR
MQDKIIKLQNYIESQNYAGWDPYDAMNSSLLQLLSGGTKYGKIAWTQFMRRCPINFRRILLVPKQHNPKGLGLFLGGYCKLYACEASDEYLSKIDQLLELLKQSISLGYSGNCWGYNFDWQSRAAFVPQGKPTIVNSSFIGHALLDCYELTGRQVALDMARSIKDFMLNDLNRHQEGDTFCFSYTPVDNNYVHNANMLGASLLIRLCHILNDDSLRALAHASLAYSMKYQHDDGSWYYAEANIQHWIDSFHTGFNLEALRWFIKLGEGNEYQAAYEQGIKYYAETFFLDDGTPKYYHNKTYPIDIHAPTEAICFFAGEGEQYAELTERIYHWMMNNMWDDDKGYFYFRKTVNFTNKIPYMRWVEAWGWLALTEYYYIMKNSTMKRQFVI